MDPPLHGQESQKKLQCNDAKTPSEALPERWQRQIDFAVETLFHYVRNLARRVEMQVSGEWMLVLVARNLYVRYLALYATELSFTCGARDAKPASTRAAELIQAVASIYEELRSSTYESHGK